MAVCHVIILQNILYKIMASYFSLASTSCNPMTPNQHRIILLHEINKTQLFLNILLILLFYIAFNFYHYRQKRMHCDTTAKQQYSKSLEPQRFFITISPTNIGTVC